MAVWSLAHCHTTSGIQLDISVFTAFSNPVAQDWSSRTVFHPAVTGTIFPVGVTVLVVGAFATSLIAPVYLFRSTVLPFTVASSQSVVDRD